MSDEERRNNRIGEPGSGHDHPEGQSSERPQRVQTPVRLAGFPAPPLEPPVAQQADPEVDSSEEKRTTHTGDDHSNEPADGSANEVSEGGAGSDEVATGGPEDKPQARSNGESSENQHVSVHGQQQANGDARSSGARLVVPASRPPDGAGAPGQEKPALEQPAAQDESKAAASAQAQDDLGRDEDHSQERAHTASESADTADEQDRATMTPSQEDQSNSATNSPAAADGALQPSAGETPRARNRAAQRRRTPSRTNASHQQTIPDTAAGPEPPEDPPERGPVAPTSGRGGESHRTLSAGEPRSETEPSRPKRSSTARGLTKIPWRALVLATAVLIVLGAGAAGAFAFWPQPEQAGSDATNQPQPQDGAANGEEVDGSEPAAGQDSGVRDTAIRDTGVAFEELSVEGSGDNGSGDSGEGESETVDVSLSAALAGGEEMVWTGTASGAAGEGENSIQQSPQDARSISLSGEGSPTSANFQAGFEMPTAPGTNGGDGEIQSGVMARTEAGEPVTHATYQRLGPAAEEPGPSNISAQGSYYIADDEGVLAEGSYTDGREDGSDRVVRTYTEDNPATGGERTFRVSFEAPPSTPIPTLVGWQPPDEGG